MDFEPSTLLSSMLVSGVGFVALVYGKKQSRIPHMAVGILLMVYPYFLSSWILILGIGALLMLLLWLVTRWGM